jgi:hypothetical protein
MKKLYTFIIILLAFTTTASAQVSEQEFQALKALYNATGGDNWSNRKGWENINTTATKDDVNTNWHGILRIIDGHVTELNFYVNNLIGVLPEEIGDLEYLRSLAVHQNKLSGPLPQSLKNIKSLRLFNISGNTLNIPFPSDLIIHWPDLFSLIMDNCGISGIIDDVFANVPGLWDLSISNNYLEGELPPSINLLDLRDFNCSNNLFSGSLPTLDNTKQLYRLNMSFNQFAGSIPDHYRTFDLQMFNIHSNNLSGPIPRWNSVSSMFSFSIAQNYFTFEGIEPIFDQINKFTASAYSSNKLFPVKEKTVSFEKGSPLALNALTLSVYNLGGNNNRYKWFKNNVEVYSGNSPNFTVPAATTEHAGIYRFEVTNTVVTDVTLKSENITVSIIGGNEAPTDILLSADNVDENFNGEVATITALDPDAGDMHTFTLATGNGNNDKDNGKFTIEGNSLRLVSGVNFETTPTLNILLMANDGNGGLFTKAFVITVNDVDEAPVFNGQLTGNTIDEDAPNGTVVLPLNAFDPEGATVIFTITSGDDVGAFGINGNKLIVADNTKLNYITKNQYSLMVNASDGKLSSNAVLTISLNKINRLPVIADAVFTIDKNSPVGTIVGTIEASDPEGDPLTYSITAGNAAGAFILDGNTIKVANSAPLDYETTPQFVLSVNVTDGVSNVQATITINLNNLQELTDNDILSFSVPGMEGTAQINDQDHTISLSVISVDITALAASFTLSPEATSEPASGTVLDFTNPQTVSVTAQSGDVQDWTITVSLTVGISTFGQAGIKLYPNPANQYVNIEGVENGSVISVLSPTGQVMYSAKAHGSNVQIPLSNLQRGLYLLKTETSNGAVIGKFLKE